MILNGYEYDPEFEDIFGILMLAKRRGVAVLQYGKVKITRSGWQKQLIKEAPTEVGARR